MIIETRFDIGDFVMIDGDKSIKAVIVGIEVCDIRQNIVYRVGWVDGGIKEASVDEWRLATWDDSHRAIAPLK